VEDDLSTTSLRKCHPEDQDELEGVVEGEPVDSVHCTLENSEESVDDPVRQPLCIVCLPGGEQCFQRVVAWQNEAGNVDEELSGNVEEDEEEVESTKTKDNIDLGNAGLLLKVVESRIPGELLIELRDLVLSAILQRHDDGSAVF